MGSFTKYDGEVGEEEEEVKGVEFAGEEGSNWAFDGRGGRLGHLMVVVLSWRECDIETYRTFLGWRLEVGFYGLYSASSLERLE